MKKVKLGEMVQFNPTESIKKDTLAKKISMGKLLPHNKYIVGYDYVNYSAGPKFRNKDTLLAKITPCLENGKTAFVDILNVNEVAFGSSEFIVLRAIKNATDANYIYYLARSPIFRERAIGCMEGTSGRKRVNDKTLQNEYFSFPDLPTQTAIANVLSSLDEKIELNNKINKELEAMAKALYNYWFVQFDFPDKNGKPYKSSGGKMVWNEQLKRNIPERWSVMPLTKYADILNGATPSTEENDNYGGNIVWITPNDLSKQNNKFVNHGERAITIKGYNSCSTKLLPINTILLSSRAPIGLLSIAKCELCTNQGFKNIVLFDNNDSNYFYYYILSNMKMIENLGTGTTFKEISGI